MNRKIILPVLILASLVILALGCSSKPNTPYVGKGQPAPDLVLPSVQGDVISLSSLKGKTVLMNFWNIGCHYCIEEMPLIQQAFEANTDSGTVILTVNTGDDRVTTQEFITAKKYTFPVLLDYPDRKATRSYQIRYVPTTFIIDGNGTIKNIIVDVLHSQAEIEALLR